MSHAVTSNSAARGIAFLALLTAAFGLFSLPAALLRHLQPTASAAATFTVNSTGDGADGDTADNPCDDGAGNCTLRAAIQQANATAGADTIAFQLGSGPQTIKPAAALPALSDPVVIDGATQPGHAGTPAVEIDGSLTADADGLVIAGGDSTVRGLVINGFPDTGIFINVKGGNLVEGCYVGTDMAGSEARRNRGGGIVITTSNNRIGGTTPSARNVISGNDGNGIQLSLCCTGNPPLPTVLSVTDSPSAFNAQYNPGFVYMQYAGYLRRHPTETPDLDFEGFDFWLAKLDSFTQPGEDARDETVAVRRAQRAEMVRAFISSAEYRRRFGQ